MLSSPSIVDFPKWRKDLELLKSQLAVVKRKIWPSMHINFEQWFGDFLSTTSTYGAPVKHIHTRMSETSRKAVRNLGKAFYEKFKQVAEGNGILVSHADIVALQAKTDPAYQELQNHIWEALSHYNTYLSSPQRKAFCKLAQDHLNTPEISTLAIAVLQFDQGALTNDAIQKFIAAMSSKGLGCFPYIKILKKVRPQLHEIRTVSSLLKYDAAKTLTPLQRKQFVVDRFKRLCNLLHDLSHDDDFHAEVLEETVKAPIQFSLLKAGAANPQFGTRLAQMIAISRLGDEGRIPKEAAIQAIEQLMQQHTDTEVELLPPSQEMEDWGKQHITRFVEKTHQRRLPTDMTKLPTLHMACVYQLNVGLSALKEYMKSYTGHVDSNFKELIQSIRRERNYLAHGDEMRDVAGLEEKSVHITMLANHVHKLLEGIQTLA